MSTLQEGFNPFNLNKANPLADIELSKICYFDTETTGINPKINQIVEIAAMLGDKQFYEKIELTDETKAQIEQQKAGWERKRERDKSVEELLTMTNYYDEKAKPTSNEKEALLKFKNFIANADFLLAHNASFDMKMVNVRLKHYGEEPIKDIPVLDSLAFSRRFFVPAMVTIEQTSKDKQTREKAKGILDQLTKQYYKSGQRRTVTSTLGALTKALMGQIENWHQALADVQTTKKLVEDFFKLLMDKHITSDHSQDIRRNKTFKDYYMRNRRMEDRLKKLKN